MTLIRICPSYAIEAFWGRGRSGGWGFDLARRQPWDLSPLPLVCHPLRLPPSPPRQTSAGGHSPENVAAADLEEPAGAAGSAAAAAWAIRKRFGECGTVPTAVAIRSRHSRTPGLRVYWHRDRRVRHYYRRRWRDCFAPDWPPSQWASWMIRWPGKDRNRNRNRIRIRTARTAGLNAIESVDVSLRSDNF